MGKRTEKEWSNRFIITKNLMEGMNNIWDIHKDEDMIKSYSTMLRNPIIFDNNVKDVKYILPYHIEGVEGGIEDHLVGMSNIVLFIFKKELHKKWNTLDDFKNTLKALNVLLKVPKKLNDSGSYKFGWHFDIDSVEECLNWDKKLKLSGIDYLISNDTKEKVDVSQIRNDWFNEYKDILG
jgi:hypothetical protein